MNLFKIKHKPYYFYSFVENKWIYNEQNNNKYLLNENDIVTRIDELTYELAMATATGMMVTATATAMATEMETAMAMAYNKLWNEYDRSSKEKRIELIKSNFHVYFVDNKKTIIWKELLEKIA